MDSISRIIALYNVSSGSGTTTIDAVTLGTILKILAAESAVLAILAVLAALTIAHSVWLPMRKRHRCSDRRISDTHPDRKDPEKSCAEIRKQLDEMVLKTNERNNYSNSIFSSIEDGFMLADMNGKVALYNPRARELLGIGPGVFFEIPGKSGVYTPAVSAILEICGSVRQTGEARQMQLEGFPDRILDVRVVPVANKYRNAENLGSLAIVKDVTEIRKMESLKKDFVATVSHEFRTPLTLISGFMEMFRTESDIEADDRKRALEIVGIETVRLKRLVSELLTLSKIENSLPQNAAERIDVKGAMETIAASLGTLALERGQSFSVKVESGVGNIRGNAEWFQQAVRNIVENAIKYTPKGGTIRIDTGRENGELKIAVSDTGIGIAQGELDRIFDRFYRVEKSRGSGSGGSGLGLALVKDICAISGGRVEVESEPGRGSIFTLRFPLDSSLDPPPDRLANPAADQSEDR